MDSDQDGPTKQFKGSIRILKPVLWLIIIKGLLLLIISRSLKLLCVLKDFTNSNV